MKNRKLTLLATALLSFAFSLPALATLSISTQPLFVTTAVPPNILVIIDDSGSMASAFVPDSLDDSTSLIVFDTIPVSVGTTTVNATVIVTNSTVNSGTVTATNNTTTTAVTVANGSVNFGTVSSTNSTTTTAVTVANGTVNHTAVHITGPSGGKYTYSCTTAGYTLNPASPTKGTSSTAAGYSCDQQTYNYSCASGFTLNPSTPTNGTSSTASGYTCQHPSFTYSCASGFTLHGSSTGTTSTPPGGTTCQQQTYNYSCPTGYTLGGPTSGTSSTGSGTTCTNPAYTYSCATGFTLNGASTGTSSTIPSGTTCTQQTYSYSCPSGYTRTGSSTGTSNPPTSTTCGQSVPTYTCPSGWTQIGSGSTSTCQNYVSKSVQGEQAVMFKSATYNPLAYDPGITYSAPFKADGTLYSTTFTTAYINGYDTTRGNVNLSTSYRATVSYDPSSTSQTTNDCDGTFTGTSTTSSVSCANSMGGVAAYYYTYVSANSGCTAVITDSRCYTNVPVTSTSGPGSSDERQNFANWYSFYRTRNLTTVSSADRAFAQLATTMRVGWINLGSCTAFASTGCTGWSTTQYDNRIAQFTGTHRTSFFNWLSRFPADVSTPLRTALQTAGEYYKTSGVHSPYAEQPQVTDGTEFVCRPNYTVMMTDGLWNSDSISSFGNTDKTAVTLPDGTSYTTSIKPYFDSSSNSLADIAFYYWKTNLRSDLGTTAALQYMPYNKNVTVTDSVGGTASLIPYWNPQNDPASWPHMNTFTVGLGMTNILTNPKWAGSTYGGGYGDMVTGHTTWPAVSSDSNNNVYDLWHAALNGRGQFFSADSPQDMAAAFNTIVSRITGRVGSSSAIAVNSTRLDSNTFIYQAQFNSGDWSGEVLAYKINSDGSIGAVQWQATSKLPAPSSRNIISWDDTASSGAGAGIDFTYATLNTAEKAALDKNISGTTDSKGTDRVAYLRGDQSKEQSQSGGVYRNRASLLGDIVNSNPLFIGTQNYGFNNLPGSEGSSYTTFVNNKATRTQALVVGGNDGMLHAFDANSGVELFAYVPRGIYGNLSALTDPLYTHQFYVDGSPQSVDAYISSTWKTLLAGTTGAGGREIFLMDVSNPSAITSSSILWDYDGVMKSDSDLGYTIGQPTIARMHDGDWYVIFGNGYNSPNQHAVLYLYNIRTKAVTKFDTGVGSATANNGMSGPNPVDYSGDRVTDAIYAGDLLGNVWKLDVSSATPSNWKYFIYAASGSTPKPLFTATDASGNVQPITDRPQVGLNSTGQVMVMFGTGTYFLTGDNAVPSTPPVMAFYGLIDDRANLVADQVLRANLVQQTTLTETTVNGTNLRVTSSNPLTSGSQGWYINLDYPIAQGERVVSDAVLDNGRVIFTTVIPQGTACQYGGISWLMELDIGTGSRLSVSPYDINGDGKVNSNDYVTVTYTDPVTHASATVTVPVSGKQSNVGIIKTPGIISAGSLEYKYYSGSTGAIGMTVESAGSSGGRLSWQQVQ